MKRQLMFLLLGISSFVLFFPCEAHGKNKKAAKSEQTALLIDSLIAEANFKFVATEGRASSPRDNKNDYGSIQFFPGRVKIDLARFRDFESYYTEPVPYESIRQENNRWFITSTFGYQHGELKCEFVINRSDGKVALRVIDTKGVTKLSHRYAGWIYPN